MLSASEASAWDTGVNETTTIPIERSLRDVPSASGMEDIAVSHITVEKSDFEDKVFFLKRFIHELIGKIPQTWKISSDPVSTSEELLTCVDEKTFDSLKKEVKEHFEIESGLHLVAIYLREVSQEFLFIEVNNEAIPTGRIEPFYFSPSGDFVWSIYVADVTCNEWEKIEKGTIKLPQGWTKKPILIFRRSEVLV